uniref:Ycf37 n=1 Tax=Gracilaria hainanensis TaxID=2871843 RepID=A0AAU7YPK1_9FLOR
MFEIYLILVTCFLLPICYLITHSITYMYHQLKSLKNIPEAKNLMCINNTNILYLANTYINRKRWLDCITMLEFYITQIRTNEIKVIAQYYNCMGLCYQNANIYKIAQQYYLKAYDKTPLEKQILINLANIYKLSGDTENATKIYEKLFSLNKH